MLGAGVSLAAVGLSVVFLVAFGRNEAFTAALSREQKELLQTYMDAFFSGQTPQPDRFLIRQFWDGNVGFLMVRQTGSFELSRGFRCHLRSAGGRSHASDHEAVIDVMGLSDRSTPPWFAEAVRAAVRFQYSTHEDTGAAALLDLDRHVFLCYALTGGGT